MGTLFDDVDLRESVRAVIGGNRWRQLLVNPAKTGTQCRRNSYTRCQSNYRGYNRWRFDSAYTKYKDRAYNILPFIYSDIKDIKDRHLSHFSTMKDAYVAYIVFERLERYCIPNGRYMRLHKL
jgi:hypothetical protein